MRTTTVSLFVSLLLAPAAAVLTGPAQSAPNTQVQPSALHEPSGKVSALDAMVGKKVLGTSREFLGTIVAVNEPEKALQMKTPNGALVPLPASTLKVEEDHLRADISAGDVVAMVNKAGKGAIFEVAAPAAPGEKPAK